MSYQENEIYTAILVLQAEKASWNSIGIFKISNISGKRRELVPKSTGDGSDMDSDGSDSDTDSEDEGVGGSGTPILLVISCFVTCLLYT